MIETNTDTITLTLPASELFWTLLVLGLTAAITLILISFAPHGSHATAPLEKAKARFGLAQLNSGIFFVGLILWTIMFLTLFAGLLTMVGEVWWSKLPDLSNDSDAAWRDWRFALAKFTALTAVLGAVVAFPITLTRLELNRQQTRHAEDVLFNDKINDAAASLYATRTISKQFKAVGERPVWRGMYEDDIVRRNAAIDALEGLAAERPHEAVRISRMLSVYVRELSREHPAEPVPEGLDRNALRDWARALEPKRSDMHTAVQALGRLRHGHAGQFKTEHIDLRGANMQGMALNADDLSFETVLFSGAQLQGADLVRAQLQGADLVRAQLQGADLIEAQLQGADLISAQLQGANLRDAKLQGADLVMAQLQGADLVMAQLQGADLIGAQLQGADLISAQLQGADLVRAQLQGADLGGAEMDDATTLRAAALRGVALRVVDYSKVPISQDQVNAIFGDQTVTLPDGITRPDHWPEIGENDWIGFNAAWRAWQKEIGFDRDNPST